MAQTMHVTQQPVVLEGYQAVMRPSNFGYSLSAIIDDEALIERLESERDELLKWCESKLKNPKRSTLKPEPWEEVSTGKYKVKFSWNDATRPPMVDSEGTPITDESTPIYSGATVKLAFRQKPYVLKDNVTYGSSLKLSGIQLISLSTKAGVDTGDLDETEVAALFGQTKGYIASEPNVTLNASTKDEDEDF